MLLNYRIIIISFLFFIKLYSQGKMNAYGLGHFYSNQGNESSQNILLNLAPSFKSNVSLSNPSTWHNLKYSFLSLSYSVDENFQNDLSLLNRYSGLSSALLVIPIKNRGSFGIQISPYLNQNSFIQDSSDENISLFDDDSLNILKTITKYGGVMNFKIGSSYKVKNIFSIGMRLNYLFGSSRQNNSINFGGSTIISTSTLVYNGSFFEIFFHKDFMKKYHFFYSLKSTMQPLGVEYKTRPLFDDVNNNEFHDGQDFPNNFLSQEEFNDFIKTRTDTVQLNKMHKPSGYTVCLSYLNSNNSSFSLEFQENKNKFYFETTSLMAIPNWINNSKKLSVSYIKFPKLIKSSIINNLSTKVGLVYFIHSMNFYENLIEEYGSSVGFGFKFKPIGNQIDMNYYIGTRKFFNSNETELVNQLQLGISIADLWFVRRRQK